MQNQRLVTKDEFDEWILHPVTQQFIQYMDYGINYYRDILTNGTLVDNQDISKEYIKSYMAMKVLQDIQTFNFVELEEVSEEDESETDVSEL